MSSWMSSLLPGSIKLQLPNSLTVRHLVYGALIGFSLSVTSTSLALYWQQRKREREQDKFEPRPIELRSDEVVDGVTGLIGRWNLTQRIQRLTPCSRQYSSCTNPIAERCSRRRYTWKGRSTHSSSFSVTQIPVLICPA